MNLRASLDGIVRVARGTLHAPPEVGIARFGASESGEGHRGGDEVTYPPDPQQAARCRRDRESRQAKGESMMMRAGLGRASGQIALGVLSLALLTVPAAHAQRVLLRQMHRSGDNVQVEGVYCSSPEVPRGGTADVTVYFRTTAEPSGLITMNFRRADLVAETSSCPSVPLGNGLHKVSCTVTIDTSAPFGPRDVAISFDSASGRWECISLMRGYSVVLTSDQCGSIYACINLTSTSADETALRTAIQNAPSNAVIGLKSQNGRRLRLVHSIVIDKPLVLAGVDNLIQVDALYPTASLFIVTAPDVVIQRLWIWGGTAVHPNEGGGAILADHADRLALDQLTIDNNWAYRGGGVCLSGGRDARIVASEFVFNGNPTTGRGSAILADSASGSVIDACEFYFNGPSDAGTVRIEGAEVGVQRSLFWEDDADAGAGISADSARVSVYRSDFVGNEAVNQGGGISATHSELTIDYSTFTGNLARAPSAAPGGSAIDCRSGSLLLRNSDIEANRSSGSPPGDPLVHQVYVAGGPAHVDGNVFVDCVNHASDDYLEERSSTGNHLRVVAAGTTDSLEIDHNHLLQNRPTTTVTRPLLGLETSAGGALPGAVRNNIFEQYDRHLDPQWQPVTGLECMTPWGGPTVEYNDIHVGSGSCPLGNNNLSDDPRFLPCDSDSTRYRYADYWQFGAVEAGSPTVGAGSDGSNIGRRGDFPQTETAAPSIDSYDIDGPYPDGYGNVECWYDLYWTPPPYPSTNVKYNVYVRNLASTEERMVRNRLTEAFTERIYVRYQPGYSVMNEVRVEVEVQGVPGAYDTIQLICQ